ncbi:MAG: hypothetical protein ACI9BD_000394 [Candidatus Marinamargulisbacteria bacterium]|jgi:hypothetical protein
MVLQNRYLKFTLFTCLFLAFLVSLNIAYRRFSFENQNKNVELTLSYNEVEKLALLGGMEKDLLFERLKDEAHITSIAIEEDTLDDFEKAGKVSVLAGSTIMNMYRVGHVNRFLLTHLYKQVKVDPENTYLIIDEKADYERIRDFLTVEFGSDNVRKIGRNNILEVRDDRDDLLGIGLGISKQKVQDVVSLGFNPIVRLKSSRRITRKVVRQKFLSFAELPIRTIVFEGSSILGYPFQIDMVHQKMQGNEYNLGRIEFTAQAGNMQLGQKNPGSVLRVHSISEAEMFAIPKRKAVNRYIRAAKERGVKILFLHPFVNTIQEINIVDYNIDYFSEINAGLIRYDLKVAAIDRLPSENYQPAQRWELLILSLGILTTVLFLANYYVKLNIFRCLAIYALFGLCFYVSHLAGGIQIWNRAMAVLAAILFPTLAVISQFPEERGPDDLMSRIVNAILFVVKILGISLLGAFFIVGFLSDLEYLLGIWHFQGVKISFVIPLLLIGLFFFLRPHRIPSVLFVFKRLFYAPIRTVSLMAVLCCIAFVFVFILRSGNYMSFHIPMLEDQFRETLETLFFVRPRTKEFLIGYPFLILAFFYVDRGVPRNWLWFYNVLGSVALISAVNSFCHIHTPLTITIYRTCLGLVLGFLIGLLGLILFNLSRGMVKNLK